MKVEYVVEYEILYVHNTHSNDVQLLECQQKSGLATVAGLTSCLILICPSLSMIGFRKSCIIKTWI